MNAVAEPGSENGDKPMGRKIILLSDGTGNSSAKVWRTNVWRVYESLDLSGSDQVAFYDDGVGTSSFKPAALLGGAFGFGLKRNVIDLYKFACRNYRNHDDAIYGFGFSRGAFTIRVVVGLILEQGLIEADSESELHAKAKAAYRTFRKENFHTNWYYAFQWILNRFRKRPAAERSTSNINIRFLGLWDTVAAYGTPVEEMTRGISQWIWPWQLPSRELNGAVRRACHALSIDDERTTFHPILWDERNEEPLQPRPDGTRCLADERISQVWFAGAHANVGGGYPDDSIAQIPLIWVLSEAQACGLRFKSSVDANPQTYGHSLTAQDKDGRIYDPRHGLGGYYRYGPRDLYELGKVWLSRQNTPMLPRIHESVFQRIHNNAQLYAPKGLPRQYEVVTASGQVLGPGEPVPGRERPYEAPDQAKARWDIQAKVWNTIWLRRIVYFMTVAVSIYLFAFPVMRAVPASAELTSPLRWVSDVVRVIGAYLPPAATPWIEGYARDPSQLVVVSAVLAGMLWWGGWLSARIQNVMGIVWQKSLRSQLIDRWQPTDLIYRLLNSPTYELIYKLRTSRIYMAVHAALKKHIAPALFAFAFAYLGLTLASHVLFNIQDDFGRVCRERQVVSDSDPKHPKRLIVKDYNGLVNLEAGEAVTLSSGKFTAVQVAKINKDNLPEFKTSELCQSMGVWLERNGKYLIKFDSTDNFKDGGIDAAEGFYSLDSKLSWTQKALMVVGTPLRRELIRPWFRVVARIGGKGGEEFFLDPDFTDKFLINETITATRDGELFLFVNDAVIGIPGFDDYFYKLFYRNNTGSARVTITRR
jgi:uncharacterized protein (DUF2235 family)